MYLLFGQFQSSMNFLHVVSSEEKKEERVQDCLKVTMGIVTMAPRLL